MTEYFEVSKEYSKLKDKLFPVLLTISHSPLQLQSCDIMDLQLCDNRWLYVGDNSCQIISDALHKPTETPVS